MRSSSLTVLSLALVLGSTAAADAACDIEGGTIRAATTSNISTLDPILSTTNASRQLAIYLFEGLVTLDENYELIPQLADSWEISEDRLTYTFTLREGIPFHNGDILEAEDVTASLNRFLEISPGANRFENVEAVETVDSQTVRVTLSADFPFLANLAMPSPVVAIMPKEVVEAAGSEEIRAGNVVGTGPFSFQSWQPDVAVEMNRFEDYVTDARFDEATGFGGAREVCVDAVHLLPVTEEASRVAGLLTGDFDFAEAVSITAVPQLQAEADINVEIVKPRWAILLELGHRNPIMQNVALRQALVEALDPQKILLAATFGQQDFMRTQSSIFYPEQTAWNTDAGGDIYGTQDIDRVRELLAEAGYKNEPIVYLTNQDFGWMFRASQAIASQWREAGINVQLELMDWPSQIQRAQTRDDWSINQTGWSPRFDPVQTISAFQCGSLGAFGYCSEEMDASLAVINSGASFEDRRVAWEDVQRRVWDDVVVIRIGDYFEPEATRSWIDGFRSFYTTPRFWNVTKAAQ